MEKNIKDIKEEIEKKDREIGALKAKTRIILMIQQVYFLNNEQKRRLTDLISEY